MGKRIGRRRLDSLLERNYDSTDEWGFVRPPMVPGLQRNLKIVALGQMHGWALEDLTDLPQEDATTSIWSADKDSGTVVCLAGDADFTDGAITMTTGGSSGNQVGVMCRGTQFNCSSTKKWWIETVIKCADHDASEFFFGLHERDVDTDSFHVEAAAAGKDRIGFVKATHNADAVTYACSSNGDGTISTALDTAISYDADNDVLAMGIHWDGAQLKFYSAISATGTDPGAMKLNTTVTANIPTDSNLSLMLMFENGGGADESFGVNFIRGAYEV
tara:strand:+ start:345 stop:1166 length:822 start_codon:yes stop_codon:yes gene_type:complete